MTALGDAELSPKAESTKGGREGNHAQPRSFAGAIKQLFREVKKLLTYEAPALEPKPKRKRVEDPHGLFKMAGAILRTAATRNPRAWFKDARQALRRVVLPRNHPANFAWDIPPDYAHAEHLRILQRTTGQQFAPQPAAPVSNIPDRSSFSRTAEPARHVA